MPEFDLAPANGTAVPSNGHVNGTIVSNRGLTREEIRAEIDGYVHEMQTYRAMDPEEVFRSLSGITSRLTEIRLNAMRSTSRHAALLRGEIDVVLAEADRQFRVSSRLHATRQFDADLSGRGQT